MIAPPFYNNGNRQLQDAFGSRALADRLTQFNRTEFTDGDRNFIASLPFFFLATADADGRPDCSFKGGAPGFVQVTGAAELAFPDYDGNGMFKSLGNILENPQAGLLFIAMNDRPQRLRVNGTATIDRNDPLLGQTVGAQLIVRVKAEAIFANCSRYIPDLETAQPSPHVPRPGTEPPDADWKKLDFVSDVTPPRRPTFKG